ncbi:GDP/GTP exchange factor [Coniochaeta sp. 2T2.1]|nr:GDP/GTP exchange factor [Coniochaeta sp. 2T2.1]
MPPRAAAKAATAKAKVAPKKTSKASKAATPIVEAESNDSEADDIPATKAAAPKKAAAVQKTAAPTKAAAAPKKAAVAKKPAAPKKTPATKKSPKKATATSSDKENEDAVKPKANSKRKRAAVEEEEEADQESPEEATPPPAKKVRKTASPKAKKPAPEPKARRQLKAINEPPTTVLDVYVFGAGENGELGLGADKDDGKRPVDVKRPRINHNLKGKGVVQIGCGGMHAVALTNDNKILTWGVNDNCALGRNTKWEGGLRDVDAEEDDSDDDESGLNPLESTPGEVDMSEVEDNTTFVQVVGSDSASFALTSEGKVYGWGTFRASDGILGFTDQSHEQKRPMLLPDLKKIKQLATGTNHVLALDDKGKIFAWGDGAQNQLARKVFEREILQSLRPVGIGNLPVRGAKPVKIACGSYHSFVLDSEGRVYGWGLNQYGQTGHRIDPDDEESKMQLKPKLVETLAEYKVVDIAGGEHHSVACTEDGKLLTFGRVEGHLLGLDDDVYSDDNTVFEEKNGEKLPHSLYKPIPFEDIPPVASVAVGVDNSFAVTEDGQVYSWGFSVGFQTGQGQTDDVEEPTLIDNTAIRGKKIIFAGSGGPYSVLASAAEEEA